MINMNIKLFSKMVVGRWKLGSFPSLICDLPSTGEGSRVGL